MLLKDFAVNQDIKRKTKIKILLMLAKNSLNLEIKFSLSALFDMKNRNNLKYFVNDCLRKPLFDSNYAQTPSNLISLTICQL